MEYIKAFFKGAYQGARDILTKEWYFLVLPGVIGWFYDDIKEFVLSLFNYG